MDGPTRLADAATRRAAERAQAMTARGRWRTFVQNVRDGIVWGVIGFARGVAWSWKNLPVATRATLEFAGACIALGFIGVLTAWELNNSGQGWALIFAAWGAFAWIAGVSVAGWAIWSHRKQKEHEREKAYFLEEAVANRAKGLVAEEAESRKRAKIERGRSQKWFVSSMLCAAVTLFGVFSNLVSHSAMDADAAIEHEEDRAVIRGNIRRLEREFGNLEKPSGVEFTRETLSSYLAEAKGWEMANLDAAKPEHWDDSKDGAYPGAACFANLPKKRQRDLCKLAADIRAELKEAGEMQLALDAKALEIKNENTRLEAMAPVAGAKHWQRMAELWNSLPGVPETSPGFIQTWGVFAISIFGLAVCFIGWDSIGVSVKKRSATS